MIYVLSWFAVASLLGLWSLATWALNAVAVWSVSNAPELSGNALGLESIVLPDSLALWVPTELVHAVTQMVVGFGPLVDSLLQAAPALAGGLTVIAWMVWALGVVVLLLLGAALHLLIALWRRRGSGGSAPSGGPSLMMR
ncbi:MAG: hypothetical protein IT507_10680 [Burkholderiaceae bacterium]|nr:hypothetical protein [Burkholderiaceae bacterium]